VLALRRPLFRPALAETHPDGTPREVTPGLRQLLARRRLADSGVLVGAVAHSLDVRRPSWEREGELLRPPLTYPAWMARVREWRQPGGGPERGEEEVPGGGPALGAETPAEEGERATGRELYRELGLRHRRRVLAAAAELEGSVSDEGSLLDALEARQPEWREALLADAAELARRMM
jgi:hypothetical protein